MPLCLPDELVLLLFFAPEAMSRVPDKYVFQTWLRNRHRVYLSGKGFDQVRDETVPVLSLDAHLLVQHAGLNRELSPDLPRQPLRFFRFQNNHIPANFLFQLRRRAQRDDFALVQDHQPVAALGFFHQVRSDQYGYLFFVSKDTKVLPQVAASAGIETGCRLVEEENPRTVEQPFRQFQAPLHASGKRLSLVAGAIGQSDSREYFRDALAQNGTAQTVKMSLVTQVLGSGKFQIDALRLKYHANPAPQSARILCRIVPQDDRAAGKWNHESRKDAKQRGFAAAVGAQKPEQFCRLDVKRDPVQGHSVAVAMNHIANRNGGRDARLFLEQRAGGCED
jgi:hypothetical protein